VAWLQGRLARCRYQATLPVTVLIWVAPLSLPNTLSLARLTRARLLRLVAY